MRVALLEADARQVVTEDRAAVLERLMEAYGDRVLHLAYFYLKDRQLAEDVAQEVFIKVYKGLDNFRGQSSIYTWIYRITVNLCRDKLRSFSWRRLVFTDDLQVLTKSEEDTEASALKEVRKQELLNHILKLPDHYREVLALHYFEELPTAEIAAIIDQNEITVRTRLHRARKALKDILIKEGELLEG